MSSFSLSFLQKTKTFHFWGLSSGANLSGFFRSWGLRFSMPRLVFSATFSVGNLVVAFLGTFILLIKRSREFVRPFWHFGPQLFKERSPFSRPGLGAYVSQPETFPGNFQLLEAQICLLLKLRWQFIRKRRTYRKIVFASIIAYLHFCNFGNTNSGTQCLPFDNVWLKL